MNYKVANDKRLKNLSKSSDYPNWWGQIILKQTVCIDLSKVLSNRKLSGGIVNVKIVIDDGGKVLVVGGHDFLKRA